MAAIAAAGRRYQRSFQADQFGKRYCRSLESFSANFNLY